MKIIKRLALLKVYVNRSGSYITIINTFMLLLLTLKNMNISLAKYYIPLAIIAFVGILFVGWLDTKLNFFKEEQGHTARQNPVLMEILKEVKK